MALNLWEAFFTYGFIQSKTIMGQRVAQLSFFIRALSAIRAPPLNPEPKPRKSNAVAGGKAGVENRVIESFSLSSFLHRSAHRSHHTPHTHHYS